MVRVKGSRMVSVSARPSAGFFMVSRVVDPVPESQADSATPPNEEASFLPMCFKDNAVFPRRPAALSSGLRG